MADLDAPRSPAELYLARGEEVEPYRPVMTGDVFANIEIPGVDDGAGLAMVTAHPCSMRAGAHLRSHVQMARVASGPPIALDNWDGNYGVVPLPALTSSRDMKQRAVLELSGRVRTDQLVGGSRIAIMDVKGVLLVGQRIAFNSTRVVVDLETLLGSVAHVLEEANLLEEWMRVRLAGRGGPTEFSVEVVRQEALFDALMHTEIDSLTLRDRLLDPLTRPAVRRHVMRELGV